MAETIIVTGAAGFIGRNTVAALNEQGHDELLLVDSLGTDAKWANLVGLRFTDLISPQELLDRREKMRDVRAVIHLGACSATTETDADFLLENNYRYTRELCEWALATEARFVYASSAATYGDGTLGFSDDDDVSPRLRPLNMYGYSKHMFDLWALRTGALSRIAGLKYFNVFGPHEEHKGDMRSVVSKAYAQIGETGSLALFRSHRPDYADGHQRRDFVYVRDAVAMTLYLAENPAVNGLFNCGSGTARTWLDLGNAVFGALGLEPSFDFIDMPASLRGQYQYHTEAQMTKIRTAGFTDPGHTLEDGVTDYVRWLAANVAGGARVPAMTGGEA